MCVVRYNNLTSFLIVAPKTNLPAVTSELPASVRRCSKLVLWLPSSRTLTISSTKNYCAITCMTKVDIMFSSFFLSFVLAQHIPRLIFVTKYNSTLQFDHQHDFYEQQWVRVIVCFVDLFYFIISRDFQRTQCHSSSAWGIAGDATWLVCFFSISSINRPA